MNEIKTLYMVICGGLGAMFSAVISYFGGWNSSLTTLVIFMAVDYITGLLVAAVFHCSPKSSTGTLESRAGWKGLCRKGVTFLIVLVACRLDIVAGTTFLRDATVIAFLINESVSIVENAGLMGIPIPQVLVNAIHTLKDSAPQESGGSQEDIDYEKPLYEEELYEEGLDENLYDESAEIEEGEAAEGKEDGEEQEENPEKSNS